MKHPVLEHLVIKPTLACTANCPTCAGRRELHRAARKENRLTLDDWRRVLREARSLGTWELTISGGEPSLYPELPELVAIGHELGVLVRLNSNGSLTDRGLAERLVRAGLQIVDISLYHPDPEIHDGMRRSRGLWAMATGAVRMLAGLRRTYPGFDVITQTILCRENLDHLDRLLELHHRLGSGGMLVSYLEGDFEKRHLFAVEDIVRFRDQVLPRMLEACAALDPRIRPLARRRIERIFDPACLAPADWATGTYRPRPGRCDIPGKLAIILANGDVHPCNIVEYTHGPVMGSVCRDSLADLWRSDAWHRYRAVPSAHCRLCPMNRHVYIPLRPTGRLTDLARRWLVRLRLEHLERWLYPRLKRLRHRRRAKAPPSPGRSAGAIPGRRGGRPVGGR